MAAVCMTASPPSKCREAIGEIFDTPDIRGNCGVRYAVEHCYFMVFKLFYEPLAQEARTTRYYDFHLLCIIARCPA